MYLTKLHDIYLGLSPRLKILGEFSKCSLKPSGVVIHVLCLRILKGVKILDKVNFEIL